MAASSNDSASTRSLYGASLQLPRSWKDQTRYRFLLSSKHLPEVRVEVLDPLPKDQWLEAFQGTRAEAIARAEPFKATPAASIGHPDLDGKEFTLELVDLSDEEPESAELEEGLEEPPINWVKVCWLVSDGSILQLIGQAGAPEPKEWRKLLLDVEGLGGAIRGKQSYRVFPYLLHFPVPTQPPRVFRFEAPDSAEIVTAEWHQEAPTLNRPDLSAIFPSESPRAEPVLLSHSERLSHPKRRDDERAWYRIASEGQPQQFAGVTRHYFEGGSLKVTYVAQGKTAALQTWRNLADSIKPESNS